MVTVPVPQEFTLLDLLRDAVDAGASDLHLQAGLAPAVRLHGAMQVADAEPMAAESVERMIGPFLSAEARRRLYETGNVDFAFAIDGVARFRVNVLRQYHGLGAVFRVIPGFIPSLQDLGLPPVVEQIALLRRGLVLVTGPTGSGKSSTLAAMLDLVNARRKAHLITIEDPVEFVHASRASLVSHREVGADVPSFAAALRGALREDPDVIMVGEMRDLETIELTLHAAETGALVLATLHTGSAAKAVTRIVDAFPARQQDQVRTSLSLSLKAVVAQQLLPHASGDGRVAAVEVLRVVPGVANLIREGKIAQIDAFIQMGSDVGMQTMDQSLIGLASRGQITGRLALQRCRSRDALVRAGILGAPT